jgi:microcompartment protein CcmL/EutN
MYQIEYCYSNGDLARALEMAAVFARKIGEDKVHHVVARLDDEVKGAWWVDVVYLAEKAG